MPTADCKEKAMHDNGLAALLGQISDSGDGQRTMSLPPSCYRDPMFFDLESDRIFRSEWISVAHVSQLAEPGDFICRDLFGEPLVVTRDQKGTIHVLSRVCRHRWTEIVSGSGNVNAFICPFHSWTYDLDGRFLGAPVTKKEEGFDASLCRLPVFNSEICGGFIFVNLDGEAEPLASRVTLWSEKLANYDLASMKVAASLSYECRYNWKILVETFMESYHHIGLHRQTLELNYPGLQSFAEPGDEAFGILHTPGKTKDAGIGFPIIEGLEPEQRDRFFVVNLYPFHLLALFPDFVGWFRTVPRAVDRSELEVVVLLPPETLAREDAEQLIEDALAFVDQINKEDIAVNVSQQRGLSSHHAGPGRFNTLEAANIQFSDYVAKMITQNVPQGSLELASTA